MTQQQTAWKAAPTETQADSQANSAASLPTLGRLRCLETLKLALTPIVLFIAVLAIYFPVRQFEFINFDDNEYVTDNHFVTNGLTREDIQWAFTKTHSGHWHPLTWISHMLDVELFGLNAGASHLENVVIHGLSAGLLFFLVLQLTARRELSTFVAAVWALHPMRLESVAWIAERKDVLSVFLGLLTLLAYLHYTENRNLMRYFAVVSLFALGLLAKPMLVTLPIIFLLLDWWQLQHRNALSRIKQPAILQLLVEKFPLFLLSIGSSIAVIIGQESSGGLKTLSDTPLPERIANACVGYLGYLGKLYWPTGFGIFYPLLSYPPGVAAGAVLSLILITAICVRLRPERPYLLFGWAWFIITLVPVVGFVQVGGQSLADRWTYLPHVGLIFATALLLTDELDRLLLSHYITLASVLPVMCLSAITWHELPNWRNSESIFRHALAVVPNNFMAHTNLGAELDRLGNSEESAYHYEEAARLNPGYPQALNNLGILRARQNRILESIELFEKALAIQPGHTAARYNLGLTYAQDGNNVQAATEFLRALIQDPEYQSAKASLRIVAERLSGVTCPQLAGRYGLNLHHSLEALQFALSNWRKTPHDNQVDELLQNPIKCSGSDS